MRVICLVLTLVGLVSPSLSFAATKAEIDELAMRIEGEMKIARYMEQDCQSTVYPGWEGFETVRCSYSVSDSKTGAKKTGLVIMLNPSAHLLATWVLQACESQRKDLLQSTCADYLVNRVLNQSGAQFVVAGVVYEDIIPADHVFEAYAFRDGITVFLNGLQHRGVRALSTSELEASLQAAPVKTVTHGAFARIAGTSRNEYRWANPSIDIEGLNWLAAVRSSYQEAWRTDRNELLEQWLRNNPPETAR